MSQPKFRRQICITRTLKRQTEYTLALNNEYSRVAFNEERAPENIGKWRQVIFDASNEMPMDLEIGTGAGHHFANYAFKNPQRFIIGIELKYKPLIQTIRRALATGAKNAGIIRFHAFNIDELFAKQELNNIFIHFPDPWTTPKKPKNRIVNRETLAQLFEMQRPGSYIDFKTDSREYFLWALDEIKESPYKITRQTLNLHQSEFASENFQTGFEKIFAKQGIEINYVRLHRD